MSKKKILVFIDWFYPAFKAGGPIKSVYNIVNTLSEQFHFSIITSAYDLDESEPLKEVTCNQWLKKENYSIIFLTKSVQNRKTILRLYQEISPNLVYFNSLFSIKYTWLPLFTIPKSQKKILAPRGMLGAEALKIKKWKKRLFLAYIKISKQLSEVVWHASSKLEKQEIEKIFGLKSKVYIAQNIAVMPARRLAEEVGKEVGKLKLIFFSRINEKKNLLFALEVLKQVGSQAIYLDIYGPIEDREYWDKCREIIEKNELKASYKGVLSPNQLPKVLWSYDYLFFPTKHENYGHVIAESLSSSLPVILSKNTPWLSLEKNKLGFDYELSNIDKFVECLTKLVNQSKEDYLQYLSTTFEYSTKKIVSQEVVDKNKLLFENE